VTADAETDCQDGLQIVVFDLPGDPPRPLGSNYSIISNRCFRAQFPLGKDRFQVVVHRAYADLKKLRHERLSEPHRFILKPALDARATILRLVEDDFGLRQWLVAHDMTSDPTAANSPTVIGG